MTTASLKPLIIRAVDDEPNKYAREAIDAVYVDNGVPRILLSRSPATASAFATGPTRLALLLGLAVPLPVRD